jgi:hypothetical protein
MRHSGRLKTVNKDPQTSDRSVSALWFERVTLRLGLGSGAGIIVIGVVPVVLLSIVSQYLSGGLNFASLTSFQFLNSVGYLSGYSAFIVLASRYVCRRTEKLAEYSRSMVPEEQESISRLVKSLYSMRGIGATFAMTILVGIVWLGIVTVPADFFAPAARITEQTSFGETMVNVIAVGYLRLVQATFLWTFGYAMYVIYKLGKLPLKTKHFTLDRTLGLKPFGKMCFQLSALYLVVTLMTFTFPFFTELSYPSIVLMSVFVLLGVPLFMAPMLTLRARLVAEKKLRQEWLSERQARTMQVIEGDTDGLIDVKLVNELLAIDKMEKQIEQISTWPVDNALLARFATIFALPVSLSITSAIAIQLLGL